MEAFDMQEVPSNRTYHFVGQINTESGQKLLNWWQDRLAQDSRDQWLRLCINSAGGSTPMGLGVIDFCTTVQRMRIQTIALGEISSMAIPLFLTGIERIVSPRTIFFLHEVGYTFNKDTRYSSSDYRKELKAMDIQEKLFAEFISDRTEGKLSVPEVFKMMREETRFDAKDAIRFGIAHEISTETI